jgi:hypothetical protein
MFWIHEGHLDHLLMLSGQRCSREAMRSSDYHLRKLLSNSRALLSERRNPKCASLVLIEYNDVMCRAFWAEGERESTSPWFCKAALELELRVRAKKVFLIKRCESVL